MTKGRLIPAFLFFQATQSHRVAAAASPVTPAVTRTQKNRREFRGGFLNLQTFLIEISWPSCPKP
jgi:hypothetical protein